MPGHSPSKTGVNALMAGHPRLVFISLKTWMAGTSPATTQSDNRIGRWDYRSTHIAMPMPPPMQSVARPFLASRFCIS
jgi:hypothetical protein